MAKHSLFSGSILLALIAAGAACSTAKVSKRAPSSLVFHKENTCVGYYRTPENDYQPIAVKFSTDDAMATVHVQNVEENHYRVNYLWQDEYDRTSRFSGPVLADKHSNDAISRPVKQDDRGVTRVGTVDLNFDNMKGTLALGPQVIPLTCVAKP